MNISLPSELRRFVEKKVRDGVYAGEVDVVTDALRLLKEKDRLLSLEGPLASQLLSYLDRANSDIEAMAFIVLMQATQDMDQDLKMIMAEVKAMTAAKQKLRELMSKVNQDVAANAAQRDKKPPLELSVGMGSQQAYHRACMPYADPESENGVKCVRTDLYPGKLDDIAQLEAIRDNLKRKLDSMNEMSEMTSLRLQMMMDRRSKFVSTLSNIMKKISTTQDTLVQNLK
jgi:putative addiction module CopG family antidote